MRSTEIAIEFCATTLKLQQFKGSEATVKCARLMDHLFDVLNSQNSLAHDFKAAIRTANANLWTPFLDEAFTYICTLKDAGGHLMSSTRRKTLFVGFLYYSNC